MKRILSIFIGFVHDLAFGCWAATVLAVWWLERMSEENIQLTEIINNLQKSFFYLGLGMVALVLLSGMGRTFTYASYVYSENAEALRKRMLIIKHVFLFIVFGAGIWWQYSLIY